ncbi:MAG: site-specific DNA-methyltransferase [Alphaproteobacteria bacterium]|nr:site-specific DNA-methyltransferase [Alphaproteobacteria bacterium]
MPKDIDIKTDLPLNRILQGDCVAQLRRLPSASIDMVFADPPYNLQLKNQLYRPDQSKVAAVDEGWDKFADFEAYDKFTRAWLTQARRILKPQGTLWVMGSYHNIFRIGAILQDLGYWVLNDIIWRKANPMPNFKGTRFTNAHETLIWAARQAGAAYVFNYQAMKALNDDIQMRSDWFLPICSGGERLKTNDGSKLHPTQKPESLLYRILLAASQAGDIVLDPFFGTGTTGAVARQLGRNFIGIETDTRYIRAAKARIAKIKPPAAADIEVTKSAKQQKRVPFGVLVERGLVKPGTQLFGAARRYQARVRADGSLQTTAPVAAKRATKKEAQKATNPPAKKTGSIHQLAAQMQNIPSCNGWTFWHVAKGKKLIPIDELRQKIRNEGNDG